ncbi:MAG: cyclic nucleotide-binding domain-containing protein, partial [Myxococcota bacterium]
GERAETALLVVSGDVSVQLPEGDGHRQVGEVHPGEVTGETALLNLGGQRGATVIAQSDVVCLELSPALLLSAADNPAVIAIERHLMLTIARRIRRSNANLKHALGDASDPRPLRARLRAVLETR